VAAHEWTKLRRTESAGIDVRGFDSQANSKTTISMFFPDHVLTRFRTLSLINKRLHDLQESYNSSNLSACPFKLILPEAKLIKLIICHIFKNLGIIIDSKLIFKSQICNRVKFIIANILEQTCTLYLSSGFEDLYLFYCFFYSCIVHRNFLIVF